jgi:hypothetical protein
MFDNEMKLRQQRIQRNASMNLKEHQEFHDELKSQNLSLLELKRKE